MAPNVQIVCNKVSNISHGRCEVQKTLDFKLD